MTQAPNQFNQTPEKGDLDLSFQGSVISGMVVSNQATPLVVGQPVKLADVVGKLPVFASLTDATETPVGYVIRNFKDADFPANARLEVAMFGSVQFMEAGAAIARGAAVETVVTGTKVITNAGSNPVVGYALDKASGDGSLIRVYITAKISSIAQTIADVTGLEAALQGKPDVIVDVVTLAQVNAGKVLVAVPTGKKAIVTNFVARPDGAFAALTSIELNVGAAVVASFAQAQLTDDAILHPAAAGVTLDDAFGIAGADGADITVSKTGDAGTTATNVTFTVTYALIDA